MPPTWPRAGPQPRVSNKTFLPPLLTLISVWMSRFELLQQQTGAAAAALALAQDELLVCRARVGSIAPPLGAPLDQAVGITGTCVRGQEGLSIALTQRRIPGLTAFFAVR